MKKSFRLIVALCCLIGLSATSALATITVTDQLKFEGEMRVRFFDQDNPNWSVGYDKRQYFDQRFRLQTTFSPLENVSAVIRMDYFDRDGDDYWGMNDWTNSNSSYYGDELELNRGYLKIVEPQFKIIAGLDRWSLGELLSFEDVGTGFSIESTELPVNVRFGYILEDEGGHQNDADGNRDTTGYFVEATKKWNDYKFKVFFSEFDDPDAGYNPYLVGASFRGKHDIFKFKGELNIIGGDYDDSTDAEGLQLWLNGTAKFSPKLTVGADFVYAKGNDEDDTEQLDYIQNGREGIWGTLGHGPFFLNFYPLGLGADLEPHDSESGVIGGGVYSSYKLTDKLTAYAQVSHLTAETTASTESHVFEDYTLAHIAASYRFNRKSEFAVGYAHETENFDDTYHNDTRETFMAMLKLKF